MMEGDDNMELLECQLGDEEGEEGDEELADVTLARGSPTKLLS